MKTFIKWFLIGLIAGLAVFFVSQAVSATPPTHKQWSITQWTDWGQCRPVAECGTDEGIQSRQSYRVCSFHPGGRADCRLGEILWLQTQERECEVETPDCEEPTPTPEPTPTIIPTHFSCVENACMEVEGEGENNCQMDEDCREAPTPTPTPTLEPTPTPEEPKQSSMGGGSPQPWSPGPYSPAVCNGVYPDIPLLQGFEVIDSTTDRYSWWAPIGGVDKYAVVYGYSPDALIYGVDNIGRDATSIQISELRPNTQSWLQVWAFKGECVTKSVVFN